MVFIANTLVMNGGTTFLIRVCKEIRSRGGKAAVLVLYVQENADLKAELRKYADIYYLGDFVNLAFRRLTVGQLGIFLPVRWSKIGEILRKYGTHVHVMGVFGLIFSIRIKSKMNCCISAGIYHQNEFAFTEKNDSFSKAVKEAFRQLPSSNLLFFNEFTLQRYSSFFEKDYSYSTIAPIGVDLVERSENENIVVPGRIVSVGNLVSFKTYNEHIIRSVSRLCDVYPDIHYVIIGDGPMRKYLEDLAARLFVANRVIFLGQMPYSSIANEILKGVVFVGSGTAIIEASALAIPAIVGIESMRESRTYGFFSEVVGLTYNELVPERKLFSFDEKLEEVFKLSYEDWKATGARCRKKALEFSVSNTVNEIESLEYNLADFRMNRSFLFTIWLKFIFMAIKDRLGCDTSFRERRNQSSMGVNA